jgi:hypothetical protein
MKWFHFNLELDITDNYDLAVKKLEIEEHPEDISNTFFL